MKKKILNLLLALFITVSLSACDFVKIVNNAGTGTGAPEKTEKPAGNVETAPVGIAGEQDNTGITGELSDVDAKTLDGGRFTAAEFAKYDVTVINFWGTYCGPCIAEMPHLAEFAKTMPGNINFITYCIDGDMSAEEARDIVSDSGLEAVVIVPSGNDGFAPVLGDMKYIPTTLFIDKNGDVVGSEIVGGVNDVETTFNEHIEEALDEING